MLSSKTMIRFAAHCTERSRERAVRANRNTPDSYLLHGTHAVPLWLVVARFHGTDGGVPMRSPGPPASARVDHGNAVGQVERRERRQDCRTDSGERDGDVIAEGPTEQSDEERQGGVRDHRDVGQIQDEFTGPGDTPILVAVIESSSQCGDDGGNVAIQFSCHIRGDAHTNSCRRAFRR
jgi:hypothetical protein